MESAISCQVTGSSSKLASADVDSDLGGVVGIIVLWLFHRIGGGGGSGLSMPLGACAGTWARYGYR
jgi:hypothetical protein